MSKNPTPWRYDTVPMDVPSDDGFLAFYRAYARTGIHAVTTAALTAFGTLTVVHRGFAVLAITAYALPPLVIYARGAWTEADPAEADGADADPADGASGDSGDRSAGSASADSNSSGPKSLESTRTTQTSGWTAAVTPTSARLYDVTVAGDAAVAVGEGGVTLARAGDRGSWDLSLPDGPGAAGAALHGADTTADGDAVWVAGDGGAVGRRDTDGRWVDYSAPDGDTNNLVGIAVAGGVGDETVLLVDGGGGVRRGRYRDGELSWDAPTTPGSGSSIAGVALHDAATGYVVDTAGDVFRTTDGGRSFSGLDLDAPGTPAAVAATDTGPAVATTAGAVNLYDGDRWTPERVADSELTALAMDAAGAAPGTPIAVGGSVIHERASPGEWRRVAVPVTGRLHGVALGLAHGVTVGADGAIVERSWTSGQ